MTHRDSRIIAAILAADVADFSPLMGADEAGRAAEAVAPYERATILEPDNPNAFNYLGAGFGNYLPASRADGVGSN